MSKILCFEETFHILGQVDFRVQKGSIYINGRLFTTSSPGFHRIFSPKSTSLMAMEPIGSVLLEFHPVQNGLEAIQTCQANFSNILTPADSTESESFEEIVKGFYRLRSGCPCDIPLLRIPTEWVDTLKSLLITTPVIFVCGHRKVGKSSFSRYLLNGLLNDFDAVDFVDLDPGQTEFTPAGFVARKRFVAGKNGKKGVRRVTN